MSFSISGKTAIVTGGASGMGHYHGYEGFTTFSKLRPVFYQSGFSAMKFLAPPYGRFATRVLNLMARLKG